MSKTKRNEREKELHNLHQWIHAKKGKASYCAINKNHGGVFEWANISRQYLHNIDDFISLCKTCHTFFDKKRLTVDQLVEVNKKRQFLVKSIPHFL